MNYHIESGITDRESQKEVTLLLGQIFPDFWEQIAAKNQEFPFDEISFTARTENGQLCGHTGILPFMVSDGYGGTLQFAGIASVAVDPEFRGKGISSILCEAAADWAVQNGMDALPLFTGKFGVYSNHGWKDYPVTPPALVCPPKKSGSSGQRIPAADLSEEQKEKIIQCYEKSFAFPGKVVRSRGNSFHGWKRIFGEPEFEFTVTKNGYLLIWDGAVIELCSEPGAETELLASLGENPFTLALPVSHPAWGTLRRADWKIQGTPDDVYHGEGVMIRPIKSQIPQDLYFPCADKF